MCIRDSYKIVFDNIPWFEAGDGMRYKRIQQGDTQVRLVEWDKAMVHADWCAVRRIAGILFNCRVASQFYAQMKGGKPIVPFPPDFVLTYEMFILGGVYITVLGFLICAGLPARRSPLYSAKVSTDQIGLLVKVDDGSSGILRSIFTRHQALEIQEEVSK